MKQDPLFSIIMPSYNNGNYIGDAIESALAQTYPNWELVIVDDASTDDSLDIIKHFLNNSNIKLITNDINQGVAYVAKQAVENSSGEIIGILDSDDVLHKDALMVMVSEYIQHPDYGLIYSNHYQCDKNLAIHGESPWSGELPVDMCLQEFLIDKLFDAVTISMHFRTFKRSAYDKTEGFDISLLCYEDRDLYYKLEKATLIKGINKCLYYYRDIDEAGAYRKNQNAEYYWFVCEYKETMRRLKINLPFIREENLSPFLCNIMYFYLRRRHTIAKDKLRKKMHHFLLETGYNKLNNNKFLAILYLLNSYIYGYTNFSFRKIMKCLVH